MKSSRFFSAVIICIVCTACPYPPGANTYLSDFFYINYENKNGESLLDQVMSNAFRIDSIQVMATNSILGSSNINFFNSPSGQANQLPKGNYLTIDRRKGDHSAEYFRTNTNGVWSVKLLITLRNKLTDTLTLTFATTKTNFSYDISYCEYNSKKILPPGGQSIFPTPAYITVVK